MPETERYRQIRKIPRRHELHPKSWTPVLTFGVQFTQAGLSTVGRTGPADRSLGPGLALADVSVSPSVGEKIADPKYLEKGQRPV